MKKIIVIIDLHCDASLPMGYYDSGGGNKYSRNVITMLLQNKISFLYFTQKQLKELESTVYLENDSCLYRIDEMILGNKTDYLSDYYQENVISYIADILSSYQGYRFIFHSIYWCSGPCAQRLSAKYDTYYIHTVISNGKSKALQNAEEKTNDLRCAVEQRIFEGAKYIICSSSSEAKDIHQYYGIDYEKLVITGRWVEKEFKYPHHNLYGNPITYSFSANMPFHYLNLPCEITETDHADLSLLKAFLYIGRLHINKGISQILTSWLTLYKIYRKNTPPLWIVGGSLTEIISFKQTLNIDLEQLDEAEKNFKLVWWENQSSEGISALMSKAAALIMHSKYEAGGNVILEAMSHSLPVIATPFGYAKDYICSGVNGYLVEYNDIHSLTKYMEYFIKQPYLSNYMGRKAAADISVIIDNWQTQEQHLVLYGFTKEISCSPEESKLVPTDSIDVVWDKLIIPDNLYINYSIKMLTGKNTDSIIFKGNIQNYLLWEISTDGQTFYFYYLYSILNRKCLEDINEELVITKHQRISCLKERCSKENVKYYLPDESAGYILLEKQL